jgi:hypothetical protein
MNSETGSPFPVEDRMFILPSKTCLDQTQDTATVKTQFAVCILLILRPTHTLLTNRSMIYRSEQALNL